MAKTGSCGLWILGLVLAACNSNTASPGDARRDAPVTRDTARVSDGPRTDGLATSKDLPATVDGPATKKDLPAKVDGPATKDLTPKTDSGPPAGWLYTSGNHIYLSSGALFKGRGANLHDTRSCDACTWGAPNVAEVKRRVDELVTWGATFIRLDLESYAAGGGRTHWQGILQDPQYLADVQTIVNYIGSKGVYVLLSLWADPTFTTLGWPSAQTQQIWQKLADVFHTTPHVLFGLCNEPQQNFDGSLDSQVWAAMNTTAGIIRAVEDGYKTPHHLIVVQGTGAWARRLDYYVTHPITAGGGGNIAYEVHVYDPATSFNSMVVVPAQTIPVIIGEFGPSNMTAAECTQLMTLARQQNVPHLAWTFHMRCSPDLLVDNSAGGCGVGMPLQATSWGSTLKTGLAQPW
jgi:hypothetical protein